ncbi:DUF5123 domain-containing protein [Flavobacterium hydrophilum]|uniref:DUF5123 domain-containing protein n=1 Tax=Flavobacterium hydrophilum TaxID=2211445 RepID=A0A2V4C2S5_9FLAO|nr:DUF5123 domain-containing protein [Flavobacterium hydrophilum]PXY44190.1 DUF5123 domain-containing protein [Flavobacterium hydrophilum]
MKKRNIFKGIIVASMAVILAGSCDSYTEDIITELNIDREFSPTGLKATVRNQTSVELVWNTKESVDHYVVQFSGDDPNFGTIFKELSVTADQLPVTVALEGETLYSIRVKAVSADELGESKWTVTTANTLSEQIFLPIQETDIAAKTAILRWTAGSSVTTIVLNPGNITHTITAEEKAAGIATITGLSPEASYQANLFNGTKKRGATTFTTGIDVGDGILVKNTEDLLVAIANADSGAKLFLEPGDYKSYDVDGVTLKTDIALAKSITISGIPGKARPVLHYKVTLNSGVSNLSLLNLELDGTGIESGSVVTVSVTAPTEFQDILISACNIHNYDKSLVSNSGSANTKVNSITVENSILTDVCTNTGSGDFIDFRFSFVKSIELKTSTFNRCATQRAFIREDAGAGSGTGTTLKTNVLIDSCTFYGVTNTIANSVYNIIAVRFVSNASTITNSIFAETIARFTNNAATATPTFGNNNYFNAVTLNTGPVTSAVRADTAGTALNPGFANAATGDFTISNQTLKDNKVGDPRWIK